MNHPLTRRENVSPADERAKQLCISPDVQGRLRLCPFGYNMRHGHRYSSATAKRTRLCLNRRAVWLPLIKRVGSIDAYRGLVMLLL